MAKTAVSQWDTVAANNTDLNSIPIDGVVTTPSQVDNLFREMMAQLKTFSTTVTLTVGVTVDNTIPRFDGVAGQLQTSGVTISDTNAVTVTSTSAGALLTLESTDAGASSGPTIELYRNSATPAAADSPGRIEFYFKDSGGNKTLGGALASYMVDPTNGSEDVYLTFQTIIAGALGERGYVAAGMYLAGATGGDKGAGTLNATALYVNGQSVATDTMSGFIGAPADKSYTIVLKCPYGGTINETVTKSASGTCTATFKINTTALGGTANSVSSSEQTQAHASANTFVAGDDIVLTISSNSSCLDMAFTIKVTKSF
nr:hypothetical protein RAR13_11880 [Aminobacter aminovorans]